ncbi:hypothetical protein V5F62_11715 [Xanthobacter sp. VTT E-85237]|uniref:hypothetical protein n=2 Tax=unclassified Xanthobacter TaxID=2623496 RepID=UPI00372A9EBE
MPELPPNWESDARFRYRTVDGTLNLPQMSDAECTVLIWNTGRNPLSHPGHAAVLMRRQRAEDYTTAIWENADLTRYFSFWPGANAEKGNKDSNGMVAGHFMNNFAHDLIAETPSSTNDLLADKPHLARPNQKMIMLNRVHAIEKPQSSDPSRKSYDLKEIPNAGRWSNFPEDYYHIPALRHDNPKRLGLDLERIAHWTETITKDENFKYKLISKKSNCAGAAMRAIDEGGAKAFAKALNDTYDVYSPNAQIAYMTPSDCKSYVNLVCSGIFITNNMLQEIENYVARQNAEALMRDRMTADIFTLADWNTVSHRKGFFSGMRGFTLRALDKQIERYHKYDWGMNYNNKLAAFIGIIKATHTHNLKSTSGQRDMAFTLLSVQILRVCEHLASGQTVFKVPSSVALDAPFYV